MNGLYILGHGLLNGGGDDNDGYDYYYSTRHTTRHTNPLVVFALLLFCLCSAYALTLLFIII
jgi:hypothetical protein